MFCDVLILGSIVFWLLIAVETIALTICLRAR